MTERTSEQWASMLTSFSNDMMDGIEHDVTSRAIHGAMVSETIKRLLAAEADLTRLRALLAEACSHGIHAARAIVDWEERTIRIERIEAIRKEGGL